MGGLEEVRLAVDRGCVGADGSKRSTLETKTPGELEPFYAIYFAVLPGRDRTRLDAHETPMGTTDGPDLGRRKNILPKLDENPVLGGPRRGNKVNLNTSHAGGVKRIVY